ncbi:hypothetical protein KTC28_14560 [Polymorphobacter megasporae]|nr:hypothetical protein [Polymorphobacter megasporae]UAJ09524.1 hypothetical protein KTC28_14560 [Polymorphobacter megasporae]
MMSEIDLDAAVRAGILDATTRERLIAFTSENSAAASVDRAGPDEESFRLLTGFNDIFVTIAIGLVLFAISSLGGRITPILGSGLVAAAGWGLAEYFTRIRRMALPSIVLLLAFVGGVFGTVLAVTTGGSSLGAETQGSLGVVAAAAAAAIAAYLHWRRFMVPITVAAGAAAVGGTVLATVAALMPVSPDLLLVLVLFAGLATFALAMSFDMRDRARVTRWTDVAFWLHLLAAPAIIHPVFALAGLLRGNPAPGAAVAVIGVYAGLTLVALAIDRRALLVSALAYVVYAIQSLVVSGGALDMSLALTALVLGSFLVLLSAAWRPIRARVLAMLPVGLTARLPVVTV